MDWNALLFGGLYLIGFFGLLWLMFKKPKETKTKHAHNNDMRSFW